MKRYLKSDGGYSLGIVMIFVMGVATVLGSVLSVTEYSAEAQGRGVNQLKSANQIAKASAQIIYALNVTTAAASESLVNQPNCGLPNYEEEVSIACRVKVAGTSTEPQVEEVTLTSSYGTSRTREFTIYPRVEATPSPQATYSSH